MSASINPNNSSNDGPSRKRSRRDSKSLRNNKDDVNGCYKNVKFYERASSGRPGSPHRYFEHSYDVSFQDCVNGDDVLSLSQSIPAARELDEVAAAADDTDKKQSTTTSSIDNKSVGNQVVHRHVNGLCIITAGNILQNQIISKDSESKSHPHPSEAISSIKFLVNVAPDAQSAKGKLRAKNKKRKKNVSSSNIKKVGDHSSPTQDSNDGDVSPNTSLCEVTLASGEKLILKCCVQGTIIELNHRLEEGISASNSKDDGNASLLLTDPLLDGYLAVIMPNRGTRLPTAGM